MNFPEFGMGEQRVDGYLLLEQIGQGGMATVYRARSEDSERPVALKLGATLNAARLERFRREGEITASLTHPNIVRVHASGVHKDRPYIVYEFVAGAQTLADALPEWPLRKRIEALRDVARALGYAHRRGVVHRDVKPENVLVAPDGSILLADFGLATAESLDRMTRSGVMLGTPLYMAPELAKTVGKSLCPQSDVYSLGVMLYEALTDEHPYRHAGLAAILDPSQRSFSTPAERGRGVPGVLSKLCMRCLSCAPEDRFPSGMELAAALQDWLERGEPGERSRLKGPAALLVVGLLLGVVGSFAFSLGEGPSSSPTSSPSVGAETSSPARAAKAEPSRNAAQEAALAQLRELQAKGVLNKREVVGQLQVLRGAFVPGEPAGTALVDALMKALYADSCDWAGWGLPLLEALAETGARPSRDAGFGTLCEAIWVVSSFSTDFDKEEAIRAYRALVALDVDVEAAHHLYPRDPATPGGLPLDVYYLRLRTILRQVERADAHPARVKVLALGSEPALGPVTRSRALVEGLPSIKDTARRLEVAEEALRLDPASAEAALARAHALLSHGDEFGWQELQLAWQRWRELNRKRRGSRAEEELRLAKSLRYLLQVGLVEEAEELLAESERGLTDLIYGNGQRRGMLRRYRKGTLGRSGERWIDEGGWIAGALAPRGQKRRNKLGPR